MWLGQVEQRMSEERRGLSTHLDSVREQLKEAEADRGRLSKQAVLLKEQLRESQVRPDGHNGSGKRVKGRVLCKRSCGNCDSHL